MLTLAFLSINTISYPYLFIHLSVVCMYVCTHACYIHVCKEVYKDRGGCQISSFTSSTFLPRGSLWLVLELAIYWKDEPLSLSLPSLRLLQGQPRPAFN